MAPSHCDSWIVWGRIRNSRILCWQRNQWNRNENESVNANGMRIKIDFACLVRTGGNTGRWCECMCVCRCVHTNELCELCVGISDLAMRLQYIRSQANIFILYIVCNSSVDVGLNSRQHTRTHSQIKWQKKVKEKKIRKKFLILRKVQKWNTQTTI